MSVDLIADRFIDAWFRFYPHDASEKGYARYDDRAPSYAPADVEAFRGSVAEVIRALDGADPAALSPGERVDVAFLRGQLAMALFPVDRLRALETSPLFYAGMFLAGIEALELRADDGDTGAQRALVARLFGARAIFAQAEAQVVRPMQPFHELAAELLEGAVSDFGRRFARGAAPAAVHEAAEDARRAMDKYASHLERTSHDAVAFEPMGPEAYAFMLRHEHGISFELPALIDLAERTIEEIDRRLPDIRARAEAAEETADPPPGFGPHDVIEYYHDEIEFVRREVVRLDLVSIPEGRLVLRETPEYLTALIPGASYVPPPPFSRSRTGYFFVTPVPRQMDASTQGHFFRRVRGRSLRNLVIHEVWPGHHVQLLRAAEHPRPIRKLADNDVMIEGWALYCERLMDEQGAFPGWVSPRPLESLRFRALRVLADVGIHTGALSLDEAASQMASRMGANREWIRKEVRRYATEPTQAMSYLVGAELIRALREEVRAALGPSRFRLREFHDAVLAEGSLPVPLLREAIIAGLPGAHFESELGLGFGLRP